MIIMWNSVLHEVVYFILIHLIIILSLLFTCNCCHVIFRFDAELSSAQEEIKKERALREKLMREKDQAISEKYTLEQELQVPIKNTYLYLTFVQKTTTLRLKQC